MSKLVWEEMTANLQSRNATDPKLLIVSQFLKLNMQKWRSPKSSLGAIKLWTAPHLADLAASPSWAVDWQSWSFANGPAEWRRGMWESHHKDMELLQIVRSYRFELLFMIEVTSCNFLLFTSKKHITSRGKSMNQPPRLGSQPSTRSADLPQSALSKTPRHTSDTIWPPSQKYGEAWRSP